MSDEALEALRRACARAPEDGDARLRLAAELARAGAREDAVEAALLARALGAADAGALLAGLEAPATPWSHARGGDAAHTATSPLRGPRRGEVVARAPLEPSQHAWWAVLLADGTVLLATDRGRRLAAFEGRSLAPRGEWAALDDHARDVVALADGRALVATGHAVRILPGAGVLVAETARAAVRPDGHVVLVTPGRVELRGPDLAPLRALELAASPGDVAGLALAGPHAVVGRHGPGQPDAPRWRSRELLWVELGEGPARLLRRHSVRATVRSDFAGGPALDTAGRVVLVLGDVDPDGIELDYRLELFGPGPPDDGRPLWRAPLGETGELLGSMPPSTPLAVCGDGSLRVVQDGVLRCFGPEGAPRWEQAVAAGWWSRGLVTDREGVSYCAARGGLVAFTAGGERLFELPLGLRPLAIDARGRLLALRADERGAHELLAIA